MVLIADAVLNSSSVTETCNIQHVIISVSLSKDKLAIFDNFFQIHGAKLVALQETHSIRLYFHISTLEALRAVRQLADSGQLKSSVESFFNLLLNEAHCSREEPVRVKALSLVNYCRCEQYFDSGECETLLSRIYYSTVTNCAAFD